MARMGKDGYSSADSTQISAKVPEPLKEEFRAACDAEGVNMTDVLQQAMEDYVGEGDDGSDPLPENDTLRRAYLQLLDAVDDTYRISTEAATSLLAQELQRPGESTKAVLKRLEKNGYVKPRWGTITVRRRDALTTAGGTDGVPADD